MNKANVIIELVDKIGPHPNACKYGHQIGDVFDYHADRGKLCPFALHSIFPWITTLRFGGQPPTHPDHGDYRFCCPDAAVGCVYKLTLK